VKSSDSRCHPPICGPSALWPTGRG
jgi:hypothetical protein